jgi:hypothetical protein
MAMTSKPSSSPEPTGFGGEITGFSLSDVVQLCVQNRFSGCVAVKSSSGAGRIFLREAEIVHAEAEGTTGEPAIAEILSWPQGRFFLQNNVAAARTTIQKGWKQLLLEAYKTIDERRAGLAPTPVDGRAGADRNLLAELKRIPGVVAAVVERTQGEREPQESYEAEKLAHQGQFVADLTTQLGIAFGSSELRAVTLEASTRHLVLFRGRSRALTVLVDGDGDAGAVEAEIRRLLGMSR